MSIRIDPPNAINASRLYLTIGTAGWKDALPEHQNLMTRTKKSGSEQLGNEISAMSRSRSQSISQVLCYGRILHLMEAKSNNQTQLRQITSSRQGNREARQFSSSSSSNSSLGCHLSIPVFRRVIRELQASDTIPFRGSMAMVEMAKEMVLQGRTNTHCWRVIASRRIASNATLRKRIRRKRKLR